jgi:hypothetical protein
MFPAFEIVEVYISMSQRHSGQRAGPLRAFGLVWRSVSSLQAVVLDPSASTARRGVHQAGDSQLNRSNFWDAPSGIEIFGMNGIVLGPLIAAMFLLVWDILSASRHAAARINHAIGADMACEAIAIQPDAQPDGTPPRFLGFDRGRAGNASCQ